MAKINKVTRQTTHHKVLITVQDPECIFSVKPAMQYNKVFKATNANAAVRAAASYCNKYMKEYPGVIFKYSTQLVTPYNYHEHMFQPEDGT